ncbi:hypothetical protein DKX38_012376 [Salix brachista]|uniref:Uncharacterized protein n=1 Tax=Salix brachista TaxID=2182728 RepID=A0A5N5LN86_9ROSI|nr:hypothetical protein DKX38_012376 [Salix brachista]
MGMRREVQSWPQVPRTRLKVPLTKIEGAIDQAMKWLDGSQLPRKDDFDDNLRELERHLLSNDEEPSEDFFDV